MTLRDTPGLVDELLAVVERATERLDADACGQAARARHVLRTQGYEELVHMLGGDLPPAVLGARHWQAFRGPALAAVRRAHDRAGTEGVAFVLGWMHRMRRIKQARPR